MSAPAFKVSDQLMAQQTLGAVARVIYEGINLCSNPDQLHEMAQALWRAYGASQISDGEGNYLQSLIERRRPSHQTGLQAKPLSRFSGRLFTRFTPRQRQRSPDRRASRDRRRMLGGSAHCPTISDITTPRASDRFCASWPGRSSAAAFATFPSIRSRRSRAFVGQRCRPLCTRRDG